MKQSPDFSKPGFFMSKSFSNLVTNKELNVPEVTYKTLQSQGKVIFSGGTLSGSSSRQKELIVLTYFNTLKRKIKIIVF